MIRQAISCDICGTEKKQTNHWFVAYDQGGELRVSGWSSRNRLRPGSKHLCGQTCLHKLVDEFMARTISSSRMQPNVAEEAEIMEPVMAAPSRAMAMDTRAVATDSSLTTSVAFSELESSARLITTPVPVLPKRPPLRAQPELVPMPARVQTEVATALDEPPRFSSRNWRAEAWDREREREMRNLEQRSEVGARRRSGA